MNILITGGGTGGHLYPGLEIAKYYSENKQNKVYYIAPKKKIDQEIISSLELSNIKVNFWEFSGVQRQINWENIKVNFLNIYKYLKILKKTKKFLEENKIDIVIGVGGYISYPILKMAIKQKCNTYIHEQNSYPGLVNRKLGNKVDSVFISYEISKKYFSNAKKIHNVSNPRAYKALEYSKKDYNQELNLDPQKPKILFLGGSLGAQTINELFLGFIEDDFSQKYQSILVSGLKNNEVNLTSALKDNIIIKSTNNLLKYIASSDIIISRAGATTLLEIIYLQKKSIIIPSPNVVANHQEKNAQELLDHNLLLILKEEELSKTGKNNVIKLKENILKIEQNKIIEQNLKKYKRINSLEEIDKIIQGDLDE